MDYNTTTIKDGENVCLEPFPDSLQSFGLLASHLSGHLT